MPEREDGWQMTCRYCDKPIEKGKEVKTYGYWWYPEREACFCHAECKQSGERQEAIDCQTVDASCNDCKHFKRGETIPNSTPKAIRGMCLKFNKPTVTYPHMWEGRECFEHRRVK